jgi:YHS domain-containing protein
MTLQRQENKGFRLRFAWLAAFAWIAMLVGSCPALLAADTEQVVVNRHSGLAIDGFDPVAYFTDAMAAKGDPDVEVSEKGAIWRFRNEANRAAFVARPDIYGPQFGGYDPVDVARGKAVAGRAQLWLVSGGRLYLFSREESLAAFAADPANMLKLANSEWPALRTTLSDY